MRHTARDKNTGRFKKRQFDGIIEVKGPITPYKKKEMQRIARETKMPNFDFTYTSLSSAKINHSPTQLRATKINNSKYLLVVSLLMLSLIHI